MATGNRAAHWDYSIPSANVWSELLRVLKPGAYAMLFGGTRTFHRLMVAVEDAGFLPCDTCCWMHGKGFPKSLDISKSIDKRLGAKRTNVVGHKNAGLDRGSGASVDFQGSKGRDATGLIPVTTPAPSQASLWDGYGTALKPAWEPIMLACKPQDGTYAENALRHGCGALDIDASRIGSEVPHLAPAGNDGTSPASIAPVNVTGYEGKTVVGRWPANVQLSHTEECRQRGMKHVKSSNFNGHPAGRKNEVFGNDDRPRRAVGYAHDGKETVEDWECAPECPVRLLDEQSGERPSTLTGRADPRVAHEHPADPERSRASMFGNERARSAVYADSGGASRFYYVTKASRAERDRGLEGTAVAERSDTEALGDGGRGKASVHNDHPTVKPLDLCRYFARMLLPPPRADGKPRRIVVPYSGSGSEMIGCLQAGWDEVVGIELDPKHAEKTRLRISKGRIVQHAK